MAPLSKALPSFSFPVLVLILSNLVPLLGVMFLGWSVASVLILYWAESVIIGVLNVPKILACNGRAGEKLFTIPFFSFHYGLFCFGHISFLLSFFDAADEITSLITGGPLMIAAASFFLSHFVSMLVNFFGKKEYAGRAVGTQMFMPYGRIFVMHIVIIVGGMLVEAFGTPLAALLLLIGLKTFIDLIAHGAEHEKTLEQFQIKN